MSLTPVEIRHVKLGARPFGYDRRATNRLLEEIRESFEAVWRERADLREENERLEGDLARYRELEILLRNTLISAERTADELRSQAHREAELIVEDARARAREVVAGAETERDRVKGEIRRLKSLEADVRAGYRAFLLTALGRLEEEDDSAEQAA